VNVAVVGIGGWTQGWHLPNLTNRTDCKVVALVDPQKKPGLKGCMSHTNLLEGLEQVSDKVGKAKTYQNVEEMLADASLPKLDGLLCAAPHAAHCAIGKVALEAGLHVLMEKPFTTDVAEARALLDLSRSRPQQALVLNNTANWQPGTRAAVDIVSSGKLGELKHVSCVFAAPLGWLFEGKQHANWTKVEGSMCGNGFGWGQFSHTFAWVYRVTSLTPSSVYCVSSTSSETGADLYDAVVVTCTNGCTISASGVGTCPDIGSKVVAHWLFGTEGMLTYSGLVGSDNVEHEAGGAQSVPIGLAHSRPHLEYWLNDSAHTVGPPVEFEHLDQGGTGPGSMDAWVDACHGKEYFVGAGALEGLKAVATIDAMYRSALSGKPEAVSDPCN